MAFFTFISSGGFIQVKNLRLMPEQALKLNLENVKDEPDTVTLQATFVNAKGIQCPEDDKLDL